MQNSWQPSASITSLRQRAKILAIIRNFFITRDYLEVETPILGRFGTSDVYLSNLKTQIQNEEYYLQTSPEYHMKRLLAAGSGPIFQLSRVFRDDELGRWHNPEFTMLEWYQLHINHHDLMEQMSELLQLILSCGPIIKKTYQNIFLEICHIDPMQASIQDFKHVLQQYNLDNVLAYDENDRDQYLFLLMSHIVEPALAHEAVPTVIYDFPISQASLATINHGIAERFEVYYRGVELANGFHELTDACAQRMRFEQDNIYRRAHALPERLADEYLLAALEHGLPPCSGVALGIDRLLALTFNQSSISKTLAFDFSRA